jgi:hypothetical protein
MSDVKLRVDATDAFYYPDLMVGCDLSDREPYFLCKSQVIVEVWSNEGFTTNRYIPVLMMLH